MNLIGRLVTALPGRLRLRLENSPLAQRLLRGSAWSIGGSAGFRLLVLLGMILVARVLGQEDFGALGLIQATLGVLGLFAGIGFGGTATRFVAQHVNGDRDRAGRIIGLVFGTSAIAIVTVAIAVVATAPLIAGRILAAPDLAGALALGTLLMATQALRGVQNGIWAAFERFDVTARLNLLEGGASVVAMTLLAMAFGISGAIVGLCLAALVSTTLSRILLRRELQKRKIVVSYRQAWQEKGILSGYTLPNVLSNVAMTPAIWVAMTVVARDENGLAGLGLYNAAYQFHGPAMFIPLMINAVSIPPLVRAWHDGRTQQFRRITFALYGVVLGITLPIAIVGGALSPWLMSLFGDGFSAGWPMLVLLLAAAPFHAATKIAYAALLAQNRAWSTLGVAFTWAVILFGGTVVLVPSLGATGLAIAFAAAHIVGCLLAAGLVQFLSARAGPDFRAAGPAVSAP